MNRFKVMLAVISSLAALKKIRLLEGLATTRTFSIEVMAKTLSLTVWPQTPALAANWISLEVLLLTSFGLSSRGTIFSSQLWAPKIELLCRDGTLAAPTSFKT